MKTLQDTAVESLLGLESLRFQQLRLRAIAALETPALSVWGPAQVSFVQDVRNDLAHRIGDLQDNLRALNRVSFGWAQVDVFSDYWEHEYDRLREQANGLRFANRARIHHAVQISKADPRHACQLLATIVRLVLNAEIAHLTGSLKLATRVVSDIRAILSECKQTRTVIKLQRTWFLHHGSHPIPAAQFAA